MPSPHSSSSPGITRLAPLPRPPTGSANGDGGRQGRDVYEKVAFPAEPSALQPGPRRGAAASPSGGRVPRESALLAQRCGCSCIHYLVPTAPNRGPCEKQTPRGLAEEAGERFPSPCHGCCRRCPCSPPGTREPATAGLPGTGAVRGSAFSGGWRR